MALRVTLLVFDGVADGLVGVTLDVVGAAARLLSGGVVALPPGASVTPTRIVSVDGAPVLTAAKRTLTVDGALSLRSLRAGDVLLIPGLGMMTARAVDEGLARQDIQRAQRLLRTAAARGVLLAASCSSTFVLAAAGVLDGQEATTSWWLGETFCQRFPRVRLSHDRMVVRSGSVLTAGSAFAHIDLMLAIVAHALSPSVAHMIAKYLVLDERVSQSRYVVMEHLRSADPTIRDLERFVAKNLARRLSLAQMARATGTSARTLARKLEQALGTTPLRFAQRLRMAHAVHLLETTQRSVDAVAAAVGYADAAAFRRVFRRELGESPRARAPRAVRAKNQTRRGPPGPR